MRLTHALFIFVAFITSACSKSTKLTVNPDGSGKCRLEFGIWEQTIPALQKLRQKPASLSEIESSLIKGINQLLEMVDGVDVWSDMKLVNEEGISALSMTAHFPDINKVQMRFEGRTLTFGGSTNKDGQWKLNLLLDDLSKPLDQSAKTVAESNLFAFSDEDVDGMLDIADSFSAILPMLALQLPKKAGIYNEIEVGGSIIRAEPFTNVETNRAWTYADAKTILQSLSAFFADKETLRSFLTEARALGSFNLPSKFSPALRTKLDSFFSKIPGYTKAEEILINPGHPAFDYKAEVEAAKKNPGALLKLVRRANADGIVTEHAFLGVNLEDNSSNYPMVTRVAPGSPAESCGLQIGDGIQQIDGRAVKSANEMIWLVRLSEIGSVVKLTILRDNKLLEKQATLGSLIEQ